MLFDRRILVLSLILAGHDALAFTPVNVGGGGGGSRISITSSAGSSGEVPLLGASSRLSSSLLAEAATDTGASTDVSIPYDSAARLAYADWCTKFGNSPDDTRYMAFKSNYEQISVANVVAAKEARDSDTARPKDLELNEYGDMTEEEYTAVMGGGGATAPVAASEKGPLETVMEASVAQSEASVALAEAADALAEEEEVRLIVTLGPHNSLIPPYPLYLFTQRNSRSSLDSIVSKNWKMPLMLWRGSILMVVHSIHPMFVRHGSVRHTWIGARVTIKLSTYHVSQRSRPIFLQWRSTRKIMDGKWY